MSSLTTKTVVVRIQIDEEHDLMYVCLAPLRLGERGAAAQTTTQSVNLDWDHDGTLIGIEILDCRAPRPPRPGIRAIGEGPGRQSPAA